MVLDTQNISMQNFHISFNVRGVSGGFYPPELTIENKVGELGPRWEGGPEGFPPWLKKKRTHLQRF